MPMLAGPPARANDIAPATGTLTVTLEGLRSSRGSVRACLTRDPHYFPQCDRDPEAVRLSLSAAAHAPLVFAGLAPGTYALSVVHDENDNARVDMMLGIPREGVGFSRNPRLMFGPPGFRATQFPVESGHSAQTVRMKYFL